MGDRAVDCARLESVCAARHQGFESPPIRSSFVPTPARARQSRHQRRSRLLIVCKSCRNFTMCARGTTAANVCPGINDAISADDGAGIKHGIATDLGPVANNGAEFGQSGRDGVVRRQRQKFRDDRVSHSIRITPAPRCARNPRMESPT